MEDYKVPLKVQQEIDIRVEKFNQKYLSNEMSKYFAYARGKFIYVKRNGYNGRYENICRLTYDGDLENMAFALYKYSDEVYELCLGPIPNFDGTIESAMVVGLDIYPIEKHMFFMGNDSEVEN